MSDIPKPQEMGRNQVTADLPVPIDFRTDDPLGTDRPNVGTIRRLSGRGTGTGAPAAIVDASARAGAVSNATLQTHLPTHEVAEGLAGPALPDSLGNRGSVQCNESVQLVLNAGALNDNVAIPDGEVIVTNDTGVAPIVSGAVPPVSAIVAGNIRPRRMVWHNRGTATTTLLDESNGAASAAQNRFAFGGTDVDVPVGGSIVLCYLLSISRWIQVGTVSSGGGTPVVAPCAINILAPQAGPVVSVAAVDINDGITAFDETVVLGGPQAAAPWVLPVAADPGGAGAYKVGMRLSYALNGLANVLASSADLSAMPGFAATFGINNVQQPEVGGASAFSTVWLLSFKYCGNDVWMQDGQMSGFFQL